MKSRWQRRREQPSHADDWLMTYADMITLLLCFFAVFLSVSMAKKETVPVVQSPPPVTAPVAQPQPDLPPVAAINPPLAPGLARDALPDADAIDESKTAPAGPPAGETLLPTLQPVEHPVAKTDAPVVPEDKPPAAMIADEKPAATLPEIVDQLKAQGSANIEQKGDRITTMEMSSAAFFASGSAELSDAGKAVLRDVAANIKSDKFKGYQITVEGHTDDTPIKTLQFPSNWELSTARASAVVHFFLEQGVPAQRLRAAGYADTFPKRPNRDAAGNPIPANQAQNRRVVIKLEKIDKDG